MIIFFCPTPDPENPAKFLPLGKAFDDCTIQFVPDLHLPKKQMELGLGFGDCYRCQVCPKSKVGSKFRSYVFFSKRDRERHNQIFHNSLIKNRKRAKKTVVCTSRQDRIGSLSKFRCPEKTCLLPLSSGQALRRHLVSIHKLTSR